MSDNFDQQSPQNSSVNNNDNNNDMDKESDIDKDNDNDNDMDCAPVASPADKVDKEVVKALKAAKYSYLHRTSARQQQQQTKNPSFRRSHTDEYEEADMPRKPLLTAEAIDDLSDTHKHHDVFDSVAERHPKAQIRVKKFTISERFFFDEQQEEEAKKEGGDEENDNDDDDDDDDEDYTDTNFNDPSRFKDSLKDRTAGGERLQVDYRRGELLCNPIVSSVMHKCAEEGYLLQPKHHAADWTMPPKKEMKTWSNIGQQQQQQQQSTNTIPPSSQKDEEEGRGGGGGDGEGSEAPSLSDSSTDHHQQATSDGQGRAHTQIQTQQGQKQGGQQSAAPPKANKLPSSPSSSRPPPKRNQREKMLTDMKKLKEKRLKVQLANKKSGLYSATLSKSGVRLKHSYQRRFSRLAALLQQCEQCSEKTRRIRARGVLCDELVEEQAISEELDSQREMMLTQQLYEDYPLWRRPEPPTAPPASSAPPSASSSRTYLSPRHRPRPRSASATPTSPATRLLGHTEKKTKEKGESSSSSSAAAAVTTNDSTDVAPTPHPPFESPTLTRHKQEVKWHRGPVMGGATLRDRDQVSNNSHAPILPVTMAAIERRAKEIDDFSSGDDFSDGDNDDNDDVDFGDGGEDRDRDRDAAEIEGGLKARRPKSAPASASLRSFRTKKMQGKEESMKIRKNEVRFGEEGTTAGAESSSSDDEDDYENEDVEGEGEGGTEGGRRKSAKQKRQEVLRLHKRQALMGPRALVASDNHHIALHKTQLAMEIDEFVDLYGQDVFTIDYSGGTKEMIESRRVAFTFISSYLLASSKEEDERGTKKGKRGRRDGGVKVVVGEVAKDTLGIMDLFMKDMKRRHDKVQLHNRENPASATTCTESTTKEALLQSYKLYWRKQRGLPPEEVEEAEGEGGGGGGDNSGEDGDGGSPGKTKSEGREKGSTEMGAKLLREKFNDERRLLLESRRQDNKEKKEQNKLDTQEWLVQKMAELMGHTAISPEQQKKQRQAMETKQMAVEISLLFSGFGKLDKTHDGFVSPSDLVRFCKQFQVSLRARDLSAMLWLMDDHRRGKLTFDDVMKFYIRNREEFLSSGEDFHRPEEVQTPQQEEKKVIQTGFGACGVDNEQAKLRSFDGGGGGGGRGLEMGSGVMSAGMGRRDMEKKQKQKQKQKQKFLNRNRRRSSSASTSSGRAGKGEEEVTVTSDDFRSQPLLLFRVLFFVAMQNSKGEIHLMSAFQNLSQLFNSVRGAAEAKFNCIFLRDCLELQDSDRISLGAFVEHLKQQKLAVKRVRLQVNCFK